MFEGKDYTYIIDADYRWPAWAAPKTADGKFDHNHALTGDDLKEFVNTKLFPYLKGFKQRATSPNTIEYKIGEIFGEISNKIQSGYNLRDVIGYIPVCSQEQQTRIVSKIESLSKETQRLEALYQRKIACLDELKKSFLQQAFAGEL